MDLGTQALAQFQSSPPIRLTASLRLRSHLEEDACRLKATTEKDIRELPAYGIAEAGHYLRVPRATLRSWVAGMTYGSESGRKFFKPVIAAAGKSPVGLSFINLVEAHVLAAIRRKHRVDMPAVRRSVDFLKNKLGSAHPLADHRFETDGIDLFISHYGQFIAVSQGGQIAVRELLEAHLRRVERDDHGVPIRLYPFTRMGLPDEPRNIVIDPFISFGRAVINGTGVSTELVAERFKAGESADELAEDYGCDRAKIEEAIRCELSLAEAA
ncbi:hypothetical protein BH20VER3_BH20VER3_05510 [soil metagenome]